MTDKLQDVLRIANNALWFDDSSDYSSALYEICILITGNTDFCPEYMEEKEG
jgi:hypothetical protein